MIPRKCHVKRIYGKNPDGSENTDTWIDVLRIDELGAMENHGGQEKIFRLRWEDEPATIGQDTTGNMQRQTRTVRVEGGDSGIYFEVKAIDRLLTVEGSQTVFRVHKNDTANTARQVKKKRVYHRDVTLPGEATWQEYIDALTAAPPTDTDQYVDVELVGAFANKQMQEVEYQTDTTRLKLNDDLDDLQAASPATSAARLDPFQMVVNVQSGGRIVAVATFDLITTIETHDDYTLALAVGGSASVVPFTFDFPITGTSGIVKRVSYSWKYDPTYSGAFRATASSAELLGAFEVLGLPESLPAYDFDMYSYSITGAILGGPSYQYVAYSGGLGVPQIITPGSPITPRVYGGMVGTFSQGLNASFSVSAGALTGPWTYYALPDSPTGGGFLSAQTDGIYYNSPTTGLTVLGLNTIAEYTLPFGDMSINVDGKVLTPVASRVRDYVLTESGRIVSAYSKGYLQVLFM